MANRNNNSAANLGFEDTLWAAADQMRGHMDPSEYKHVVLGLIFLKYISDAFQERYEQLSLWTSDPGSDYFIREEKARYDVLEDRDEYLSENVFWVPADARWTELQSNAKQPDIGRLIDEAMDAIEQANPSLKGVLPKDYARPDLNKQRLGELIDLIGTIGLGDAESRSKDILGRVYEYFLGRFADAEGKRGGQFYTPQSHRQAAGGRCWSPTRAASTTPAAAPAACSCSRNALCEAHGGHRRDIAVYGQESNPTTWRLCKMNLAIRGIERQHRPQQRRHLPQRPAQGPARRLHPRQPALQHERLGRRAAAGRRALAVSASRPTATPTTPGCST